MPPISSLKWEIENNNFHLLLTRLGWRKLVGELTQEVPSLDQIGWVLNSAKHTGVPSSLSFYFAKRFHFLLCSDQILIAIYSWDDKIYIFWEGKNFSLSPSQQSVPPFFKTSFGCQSSNSVNHWNYHPIFPIFQSQPFFLKIDTIKEEIFAS